MRCFTFGLFCFASFCVVLLRFALGFYLFSCFLVSASATAGGADDMLRPIGGVYGCGSCGGGGGACPVFGRPRDARRVNTSPRYIGGGGGRIGGKAGLDWAGLDWGTAEVPLTMIGLCRFFPCCVAFFNSTIRPEDQP